MKSPGGWMLAALAAVLAAAPAAAQEGCVTRSAGSAAADSAGAPAVLVRATATVRELRFESQPRTRVRTAGCDPLDGIVVTERVNLPDPVEPGVTYRDVRVGIEIRAHLDVVCHAALAADPALAALCGSASNASAAPGASPAAAPPPPGTPAPAHPPRR